MLLNGFLFGLGLGLAFMAAWSYFSRRAKERMDHLVADVHVMDHLETTRQIEKVVGSVPRKIQFLEFEQVEWLNIQLLELWPYINKATRSSVLEFVEPLLNCYKPTVVSSIEFKRATLGTKPPKIEGVKLLGMEGSQVSLEANVVWQGRANFILGLKTKAKLPLQAQVKNFLFTGKLRIILQVTDTLPCIAAIAVAIYRKASMPHYDLEYDMKGAGCNLDTIPGLSGMLHKAITAALEDTLLWPNRVVKPLLPDYDARHLEFFYSGEALITVCGAEKLKNRDLFDKSDPRAVVWFRPTHRAATRVVANSVNPEWDETFALPVDDEHTVQISIEVQDKDALGFEPLGFATVELGAVLRAKRETEFRLPLCATWSADDSLGQGKLGYITLSVLFRRYSKEEREAMTRAEQTRRGGNEDSSLPPQAAREAKARALQSTRARAARAARLRGVARAAGKLFDLEGKVHLKEHGEGPSLSEGGAGELSGEGEIELKEKEHGHGEEGAGGGQSALPLGEGTRSPGASGEPAPAPQGSPAHEGAGSHAPSSSPATVERNRGQPRDDPAEGTQDEESRPSVTKERGQEGHVSVGRDLGSEEERDACSSSTDEPAGGQYTRATGEVRLRQLHQHGEEGELVSGKVTVRGGEEMQFEGHLSPLQESEDKENVPERVEVPAKAGGHKEHEKNKHGAGGVVRVIKGLGHAVGHGLKHTKDVVTRPLHH